MLTFSTEGGHLNHNTVTPITTPQEWMVWTKSLHNLKVHIKIFKLKGQNFWNLPELGSFKSHVPFLDKLQIWLL